MKLWPPWKNRIKIGDLVRFNDTKRAKTDTTSDYAKEHLRHIFEIGLVIDTDGLDPRVSFPSRTQDCATANLEVC
jgi:hypothetical protein